MTDQVDADRTSQPTGLSGGWLTLVFVAVVAAGALAATLLGDDVATAEVGAPAPPLSIETFDGQRFDLDEHLASDGNPVILNLWASWCGPCREEFPLLSQFARERPDITVVGVAVRDQLAPAREFATQMDPAFVVGFDADDRVSEAYPSFGLPATYLIGSDGTVLDLVDGQVTSETLDRLASGADGST